MAKVGNLDANLEGSFEFFFVMTYVGTLYTNTTGNSDFSVGAKTHGKMLIPTEKCFSDGDRQKNTHGNRMTENLNFSVGSPSEKHISVGQALTEKLVSARSKKQFSVC
jgi:hypothetical protein